MPTIAPTNILTPLRAYVLNGVLWVPHYRVPDMYVAPEGRVAHEGYLTVNGARRTAANLNPRTWTPSTP